MKRLLLSACLIAASLSPTYGQMAVIDATNQAINQSKLINSLEQLEKFVYQIRTLERSARTTKMMWKHQKANAKNLTNGEWKSLYKINDRMDNIENISNTSVSMKRYVKSEYQDLYDTKKRMDKFVEDLTPHQRKRVVEEFDSSKTKHLGEEFGESIAMGEETKIGIDEDYSWLKDIEDKMAKQDLSPQQTRQLNGKLSALQNKHLIELKRLIAHYTALIAKEKELAQGEEDINEAKLDKFEEQFDKDFKSWKNDIKKDGIIKGSGNE